MRVELEDSGLDLRVGSGNVAGVREWDRSKVMWQESGSETGGIRRGESLVSGEKEIVRKVERSSDGFGF